VIFIHFLHDNSPRCFRKKILRHFRKSCDLSFVPQGLRLLSVAAAPNGAGSRQIPALAALTSDVEFRKIEYICCSLRFLLFFCLASTGAQLIVPHPVNGVLYLKLRDDPETV
jgi:hypothetical protein